MSWIDQKLTEIATFIVELSGNGYDPEGSRLPAFKQYKPPTAKVPKKEAVKNTGGDWVGWDGQKVHNTGSNAVELDNYGEYGITEREYGEMLMYDPPLRNLEIAGKVKKAKENGEPLADVARRLNKDLQTIRHYSSALYKATK